MEDQTGHRHSQDNLVQERPSIWIRLIVLGVKRCS
jgi:hypothetical protein